MTLRIFSPPVRFGAILVATVFLGPRASAQSDNRDPFEIMRGGEGDRIMAGNYMRDWGTDGRDPYNSSYDQARYFDLTQSIFVPPAPPALGEGLPGTDNSGFGNSIAADCERETFYGGYVTVAQLDKLTAKDTERIAIYRSNRQQLLNEIRAKFEELAAATQAGRRAGLMDLAAQQETRLRSLADDAETIRSDLAWINSIFHIRIAPLGGSVSYGLSPEGHRRITLFTGQARVEVKDLPRLFSSAYFYAGLSAEQRHMLPEIAYEQAIDPKHEGPEGKFAGAAAFFFLPATARVPLPANLPPALEEKIRDFAREKENLKSDLRAAVLRDDYFFVMTRTRRLSALAEQQAPRFAALDALAEEIRVGLAGLDSPYRPGNAGLPADLTLRMGSFNARKVVVRRELLNRLRQLSSAHPDDRFEIARQGDGLAIVQTGASPEPVAGLAEFNASQARQYTAFARESESLRRDIQNYLDGSPQRGTRTVDQLAGDFAKAYATRENGERDRDYSRAVLEPGLSAAQRRLLFQAALMGRGKTDGSNQAVVEMTDLHGPLKETTELLRRSTP